MVLYSEHKIPIGFRERPFPHKKDNTPGSMESCKAQKAHSILDQRSIPLRCPQVDLRFACAAIEPSASKREVMLRSQKLRIVRLSSPMILSLRRVFRVTQAQHGRVVGSFQYGGTHVNGR